MTTAAKTRPATPITREEAARRYPILTAHLICESLGYFTPSSAANALASYINGEENCCEWYMHMAQSGKTLLDIGRETIERAIRHRHSHRGFMAHYPKARILVDAYVKHNYSPAFQSW